KAASLSLFFELFTRDVDDHILEIIDEDDLSFDPVVVQQRSKVIALEIARIRLADGRQRFTIYNLVDASSHEGGAVYRVSRGAFSKGDANYNLWRLFEDHVEESVVGAEQVLIFMKCHQQLLWLVFEEIYEDDVVSVFRKIPDGAAADVCSLG